jgi:membrane protease YdiL (CAAX protease family)
LLEQAAISALTNLLLVAGIPFLFYFAYHKWRRKRGLAEIARRTGLRLGEGRYIGYSLALAAVASLVVWQPPLDPLVREGSAWRSFVGLDIGGPAIPAALLYGVVKTGLPEELLFRGLITGSLSRRLPVFWANFAQALIFLLPHLLFLRVMPEMWGILLFVFAGSLFVGWVRNKSGSIVGPWLVHASVNTVMGVSVSIRTAA